MMNQNPFLIDFGQDEQQQSPLSGLAGLVGQYGAMKEGMGGDTNSFASQTPGAPQQPGRIDQSSFGGQGDMDPFAILSSLIAKRFGG